MAAKGGIAVGGPELHPKRGLVQEGGDVWGSRHEAAKGSGRPHGPLLDPLLGRCHHDSVDEDPGGVDAVGVQIADLDQFLDLDHGSSTA